MKVPQAQRQVQEQFTQPKLDNTRVAPIVKDQSAANFNQIAQGLNSIAQGGLQLSKEMEAEKEKARGTKLEEYDTQLMGLSDHVLSNDKDGYLHTKGNNAITGSVSAEFDYDEAVMKIEDSIQDKETKERFKLLAEKRGNRFYLQMNNHSARQTVVYENETAMSNIAAKQADAVTYSDVMNGDVSVVNENKTQINEQIVNIGKRQGWDKVKVKEEQTKSNGNINLGVISKLVNEGNDVQCRKQ